MNQPNSREPLISIITPVYNSADFLDKTISSVISQTYSNWELILVNDNSTDGSLEVITKYAEKDNRIRLHNSSKNIGAALARNTGVGLTQGEYLAFLDADDFWDNSKLSRQLAHMKKYDALFTFTGYEFTNGEGVPNGNKVSVPPIVSYIDYLKNNIIWTSTVLIDLNKVNKNDALMPDLSYGEDATTWLNILAKYGDAVGINETLSFYRRTNLSLSSNKFRAVIKKWHLYMSFDSLNLYMRNFYYLQCLVNASRKRI